VRLPLVKALSWGFARLFPKASRLSLPLLTVQIFSPTQTTSLFKTFAPFPGVHSSWCFFMELSNKRSLYTIVRVSFEHTLTDETPFILKQMLILCMKR